jgi:hypothetical protein
MHYKRAKATSELLERLEDKIIKLSDNKIATENNQVFIIDLEKKIASNYLVIVDRIVRKQGGNQTIVYKK